MNTEPTARSPLRGLIGFNLLSRDPARDRRLLLRLVAGPPDPFHQLRVRRRHGAERHRALPGLSVLRRRLPRGARVPQVPPDEDDRAGAVTPRERGRRHPPLLRPLHRPQGDRVAVPGRDRPLLLHRRRERDADPGRAAPPLAPALRRRQLPDDRQPARGDDDGDHDLGHSRPVRQLLRPTDGRREADGLRADRVAHLLAADGGRGDPHKRRLLRRPSHRLDRLRATQRPGEHGDGLVHHLLHPRRGLDDAPRAQPDRDDRDDAGTRVDLGAAAHLLLGGSLDIGPDGARGARPGGRPADGGARPDRADLVLPGAFGRQPLPVREPVLVLRPS